MTRLINARNPRLLIVAGALAVAGIFGITAVMAWAPGTAEVQDAGPAAVPVNAAAHPDAISEAALPRGKCMECGIIESKREVWSGDDGVEISPPARSKAGDHLLRSYVLTVRMKDGARRQFVDAASADWRPGDRVIVIRNRSDN
jgi:hypothetical protein